jgi:DeoR/GlpR family transcriptional regulator of sugar metabolism
MKMNAAERQSKIVEIVMAEGSISVPDICEHFDVSEMTARRDLNEIDRQGLLRRVRGGAVANLGRSYEPPFPIRATKNQRAKAAIGLKAAELVCDGDSIALDVGTTTLEIVRGLKGKRNLTIVTSCLQIANLVVVLAVSVWRTALPNTTWKIPRSNTVSSKMHAKSLWWPMAANLM